MRSRAVFLDKDGTLIENLPYNVDPDRIRLASGASEGLPLLHEAGYRLIVISNQSGVARGFFGEDALGPVEAKVRGLLEGLGVPLSGFYYCPHLPDAEVLAYRLACSCRKPEPGLIHRAADEHAIDLRQSWLVGDRHDDVEAGRLAGCRTILVPGDLDDPDAPTPPARIPDHWARDLAEAARIVIAGEGRPAEPTSA